MQIIEKDSESNKSEEFKQINTNRETDSNSYESNGIEHDMNSSSDEHVYETPSNNRMSKYKSYKMIFILKTQIMLKLTIQMKLAIKVI